MTQKLEKIKYRRIILLLVIFALLSLAGCASPVSSVEKDYETAVALLADGRYEEAAAKFDALGSYEDARRMLMYSRAVSTAESGDYETARRALSALGQFRDAPEMLQYYEYRETEASGRAAISAGDNKLALTLLQRAAEQYHMMPAFRDTLQRSDDCLNTLYTRGRELLDKGQYAEARDIFSALGSLNDSDGMKAYCEASLLDEEGASLEAAARFAKIPNILDAAARAETSRNAVYQQALASSAAGDQETAISLFRSLGSYRDSEEQLNGAVRLLVQDRMQYRDYEGALFWMDQAPGAVSLEPADSNARAAAAPFLDEFVRAYLHFSSGAMDSWSGYYGVLPYVEQGGALDRRFIQVTMIGSYSHNSYFQYYGSELLDLFRLDNTCYVAYVRATASVNQPVGAVEVTRTFRILLQDSGNGLVAQSLEDCLYGQSNPTGRPVVTGPLPGGLLPPDEDGDGVIVVDVMKKGFNGTMIIVLDPARVFVGGPGAYGGSGMLLEELVKRYDALGGINGGGFIDEDGGGSGGLPEGLTIVDGKSYHWRDSGASAAFDENNVLHVRYYDQETAAADHIRDCVSFGPALIVDGAAEYGDYMESGINPRTAIGQRADGAVLMLVIDGRQIHSVGANFGDIRDVMLDFGAVNACSLDGGSSTVMYYDGEYINSPSSASGTSRYLPNAFLIRK